MQSEIKKVIGNRLEENFNIKKIKTMFEKFTHKKIEVEDEDSDSDSDEDSDDENNIDTMVPEMENKLLATYNENKYSKEIKKMRDVYKNIRDEINNLR